MRHRTAIVGAAVALLVAASPAAATSAAATSHRTAAAPAAPAYSALTASAGAPPCDGVYDDVLATFAAESDWRRTLVDTIYMIPSTYYPDDLVPTGLPGGGYVRSVAYYDLQSMARAAAAAGAPLQVQSAFRSYQAQVDTFNYWVRTSGLAAALKSSARAGHSEHQLGTTIDFTSLGGDAPWNYADWAATAAGNWMATNAWRYGWILSYPKNTSPQLTCYEYEPWHYRYVGAPTAAAIHVAGLTSRDYLWVLATGSDSAPPLAGIRGLPATQSASAFTVSWTAHDIGPSGIDTFDVQVSTDGGPFVDWLVGTHAWSATFAGAPGHGYAFRARARDLSGNAGTYDVTDVWDATPSLDPGGFLTVTTDDLNVRTAPGTSAAVTTQVDHGVTAAILAGPVAANGYQWLQVRFPIPTWRPTSGTTTVGWIAASPAWVAPIHAPNTTGIPPQG